MKQAIYWQRVHHRNRAAVRMADRHYSRRTIGAPEFVPPGEKVVLMAKDDKGHYALWASNRIAPVSGITRYDGLVVWDCCLFRKERRRDIPSSEMIREAVAITLSLWGDVLPRDGFVTTVNPRKVPPTRRRGRDVWGYCFLKAGFRFSHITKARALHMLQLPMDDLIAIEPVAVEMAPLPLFAEAAL